MVDLRGEKDGGMRIVDRVKVEDCFDGSSVFVYKIDLPWTEQMAGRLASLGEYRYYREFPRPLFKMRTQNGLFVDGVEGSNDCRVVLPRTNRENVLKEWEEVLMGM